MDQYEPGVHQIGRPRLPGRISGDVVPAHLVPAARPQTRRAENGQIGWTAVRMEALCGRLVQPTTYRLSRFVPRPDGSW
ncbi:hypothetical protein EDD93_4840 [Streptomyces sp. 840.1]|uniref:hypothetical protein n=1 Tax=Streptomyces sp. 840.1 TaxID=2485152 RepID=UPI000F9BB557|nr:hypothetical protein [Streptomyces sp. 840.1]ROQ70319.1 hypothetical protein EDD93_4840 [Streptomyces sp. 840.1]